MAFLRRKNATTEESYEEPRHRTADLTMRIEPIPIPPGDALETALLSIGGPVTVADLDIDSAAMDDIRRAGVELIVPLVGQGELLGALYLGSRLSEQAYSADDRRLLNSLASRVAPAMKVAQLVRTQQAEAEERERIQQELKVAALIQQTLLPKELPSIPGWQIDAFYRPARAVGGDFYDFIDLGRGRQGVVIGDVTDKGVPAALVMATCRSMLRAAALQRVSPSAVLEEVNEAIVDQIPPAMFVTCLYAIIDTVGGEVVFANAGHNLPYVRSSNGVIELRATGMPLGLMSGMTYDEKGYEMSVGDVMVLTSDGITEAHSPSGEMYGFGRLMARVARRTHDDNLVDAIVDELEKWTGPEAEQEDDITLVVVNRNSSAKASASVFSDDPSEEVLSTIAVPSIEGNEIVVIEHVVETVGSLGLEHGRLERLKTAVGEAVMNAIEHGNGGDPSLDVNVDIRATEKALRIRVSDQGGTRDMPDVETPDLDAKIAGEQTPRGWGLFLIQQMVDDVRTDHRNGSHTVELILNREGES